MLVVVDIMEMRVAVAVVLPGSLEMEVRVVVILVIMQPVVLVVELGKEVKLVLPIMVVTVVMNA